MNRQEFPPKFAGSIVPLVFDYTGDIPVGDTIDTAAVAVLVYSGDSDPDNPAYLDLVGTPVLGTSTVTQLVQYGVEGVVYDMLCELYTVGGLKLNKHGYLAVVPG